MNGFSKACCTLPPVEADYTPKGTYTDIADLRSYVVGPEDAKSAILIIFDIFGFTPQALQGADLLASQGFRIVMPDILKGNYATGDMYGPGEEAAKKKEHWFSVFPGAVPTQSKPIAEVAKAVKSLGYSSVGAAGFCWGYKVIVMSEGVGEFAAIAASHPTFPDPSDAEKINVPLALFPSKSEDQDAVKGIYDGVEAKNPGKNVLKPYMDFNHGFAAARADLRDPKQAEGFHQVYTDMADFFKAAL